MKAYTPEPTYVRIPAVVSGEIAHMTNNRDINLYNDDGVLKKNVAGSVETIRGSDQATNTTSDVTFSSVNTGPVSAGALTCTSINTGLGATEVYPMNQDVRTDSNVTFASIDTGQGANELFPMNQPVRTTDQVTFGSVNTTYVYAGSAVQSDSFQSEDGSVEMTPMPTSSAIVGLSCTQTLTGKTIDNNDNTLYQRYIELVNTGTQVVTASSVQTIIFNSNVRSRNFSCGSLDGAAGNSYITIPDAGWYFFSFHSFSAGASSMQYRSSLYNGSSTYYGANHYDVVIASTRSVSWSQIVYFTGSVNVFVNIYPVSSGTTLGDGSDEQKKTRLKVMKIGS